MTDKPDGKSVSQEFRDSLAVAKAALAAAHEDGVGLTSIAHPGAEDLNPDALEEIEIELPTVAIHKDVLAGLLRKTKVLVNLITDAEVNQGGLLSVDLLRAANELKLELSKWK